MTVKDLFSKQELGAGATLNHSNIDELLQLDQLAIHNNSVTITSTQMDLLIELLQSQANVGLPQIPHQIDTGFFEVLLVPLPFILVLACLGGPLLLFVLLNRTSEYAKYFNVLAIALIGLGGYVAFAGLIALLGINFFIGLSAVGIGILIILVCEGARIHKAGILHYFNLSKATRAWLLEKNLLETIQDDNLVKNITYFGTLNQIRVRHTLLEFLCIFYIRTTHDS